MEYNSISLPLVTDSESYAYDIFNFNFFGSDFTDFISPRESFCF